MARLGQARGTGGEPEDMYTVGFQTTGSHKTGREEVDHQRIQEEEEHLLGRVSFDK